MEAKVARSEIELLIIGGIVGDVHLAVFAGNGAVGFYHHRRVVVQSGGTLLEERGDDDHAQLACQLTEKLGRRSGNGLGKVEEIDVFRLAEVKAIVKFLQHNESRAFLGEFSALICETLLVQFDVGCVVLLYYTYFQFHVRKDFNYIWVFNMPLGNCIVMQCMEPC